MVPEDLADCFGCLAAIVERNAGAEVVSDVSLKSVQLKTRGVEKHEK